MFGNDQIRKIGMRVWLPLLVILSFLCSDYSLAQLDTKHYFSPMNAATDSDGGNQFLYLSTPSTTAFTVTITDGAGTVLTTLSISNSAPASYAVGTSQTATTKMFVVKNDLNKALTGRGLILTAPQPFYANFRTESGSQAEMISSKGSAALGTTFRVGGIPLISASAIRNFTAGVMATEPGVTHVTISGYNPAIVFSGATNFSSATITFSLNQGECYVVSGLSTDNSANLNGFLGALVQSDKKIVLDNGNILGVPGASAFGLGGQDICFDQSAPIERIGKEYIVIEANGVDYMEVPIVIAHYDNTQIFVNGSSTPIATINAGKYFVIPNTNYQGSPHQNMYIKTSQPAYVYQSLAGAASDATGGVSFIPPINCYLPNVIDNVSEVGKIGSVTFDSYAMIFTQKGATVTVNGAVQTGAVAAVGAPWETYRLSISGNVKVTSTNAMAMGFFGASGAAGYAGYFAGFSNIPDPTKFTYVDTCLNATTQFTSIHNMDNTITGFGWNFGDAASGTSNTSALDSPSHVFSAAGNYKVQLIVFRTTCNDTVSRNLKIISATTATITGTANACLNTPEPIITFTGANGTAPYTFTYHINNGTAQSIVSSGGNSATITAPTATAGTFKYYLTAVQDASGPSICGNISDSVTITVNSNLQVAVNSAALCFGEVATLTASGANTYSWSPATGLSATTGATVTSNASSPITYTVIGTSNGCAGTAYSTVSINPTPDSNAGTDITICSGVTGTIGAPSTAGYVYSWLPAAGLSSTTVANPTVNSTNYTANPITITYTVTTSPAGCFSTDEVVVTINPSFDATFNYSSSTYCQSGGGANPSPTIVAAGGTFSSSPAGLSINASNGLIDLASSALATYTVTYTTTGSCISSSSQNITITNIPNAQFSYGVYCQNESTIPIPSFPIGASGGVFTANSPNLIFLASSTSPSEIDLAASTPGTYTITNTITAGGGCPNAVSTNTIVINAVPSVVVNSETVCTGSSVVLTASGADTYSWSDGSLTAAINPSTLTSTSYTVTGSSFGCTSSAIAQVTVNAIPNVAVNSLTICAGDAATLSASGATTYAWTFGPTTNPYTDIPLTSTSYTVTGISSGCSGSAVAKVVVNLLPVIIVNDQTICSGGSSTLTASGANSYSWSDGSLTPFINVNPLNTTSYSVTGTTLGCKASAIAKVTVNPIPNISITPNSPSVCLGATATLTAAGASSYVWSTGASIASVNVSPVVQTSYSVTGTLASCSASKGVTIYVNPVTIVKVNSATICLGESVMLAGSGASNYKWSTGEMLRSIEVSPKANKSYTVTGNPTQCPGMDVANVTVKPLPDVSVQSKTICPGREAILEARGAFTYVWSNGSSQEAITVNPKESTKFSIMGTDQLGCKQNDTVEVIVSDIPKAEFNTDPNPAKLLSPEINFTDLSSPDVTQRFWNFGDGDSLFSNSKYVTHTYPQDTGTYSVTLLVSNAASCTNLQTHYVRIDPEFTFYMPTAFSPDGDGINDVFFAKGSGIGDFQLSIFDRWGNFIFFTDDMNKGWDGKTKSSADIALQDTYIWKVALTDVFKKKYNYIGVVTILK